MNQNKPNNQKLEQVVLGLLMIELDSIHEVIDIISEDLFYDRFNKYVCRSILELYNEKTAIDIITVTTKMMSLKTGLENIPLKVTQMTSRVTEYAHNLPHHIALLQGYATKRNCIASAERLINIAYDDSVTPKDCLEVLEIALDANAFKSNNKNTHVSEDANKVLDNANKSLEGVTVFSGLVNRNPNLRNIIPVWGNSDLVILAARPAMGKSADMTCEALNQALEGIPVFISALEMSRYQIVIRMLSNLSGVNSEKIRLNQLSAHEVSKIEQAVHKLNSLPIYIDDDPSIDVNQLRAKTKRHINKFGVQMVFVDYLQLMTGKGNNTNEKTAEISRGLKLVAKENNIPVVALAQLSRAVEARPDKKPQLSDLRDSGAIEQDADVVIFLYRAEYYGITEDEDGDSTEGKLVHIVAKQRGGRTGESVSNIILETNSIY